MRNKHIVDLTCTDEDFQEKLVKNGNTPLRKL